jgi:integrase
MPNVKLTAVAVDRLRAPDSGRVEYFDLALPSFALRVTDKGSKSWVVFYRIGGRLRRMTLGSYPALGLAEARTAARGAMHDASRGVDPAQERAKKKGERPQSVEGAVHLFVEKYVSKKRSANETERIFNVYVLPKWRKRALENIARRDVIELLDMMLDKHGPYITNRTLAAVRRFFNWCVERDLVPTSPTTKVRAPGKEAKRERILSDGEIKAVWDGFHSLGWPFGPLFQLLLVTAQRRGEIATMRWEDIDLEDATWTIPREFTKADRAHSVPLSPPALDIVRGLPEAGEFVFTTRGSRPVSGFSKAKARVDALSAVSDWRLHDLRRTAASGMARLNVPPHVLSKVLNHAPDSTQGITAIYNRYGYDAEKRHAMEAWGRYLGSLITPRDDKVISIGARHAD